MIWKWQYIAPHEILSPTALKLYNDTGLLKIHPSLLDRLTQLREKINKPILINHAGLKYRGFRNFTENENVGGSKDSLHMLGLAADVTVSGMDVHILANHAYGLGFTGIGVYPKQNFVHMDLRTNLRVACTRFEKMLHPE